MKEKPEHLEQKKQNLRKRAEELMAKKLESLNELSKTDIQSLVHELQVHQIELDMQNEELRQAQQELEESRNKYADLYDFAPVGYFTLDKNGFIVESNLTGATLLHADRKHLIKQPFSNYIDRENQDLFYLYVKQLIQSAAKQTCEIRMLRKNGTSFYAQLEGVLVSDNEENHSHIRIAVFDITERKKAEEELGQNLLELARKSRYQLIVNSIIQSVHRSINLQDVLENAVESMHWNIDGADNVSIYFVEGTEAVMKANRGYPDWFIKRVGRIPYPKGFTWKTIIEGKPGYVADVDQDTAIGPAGREIGTKSYASMPIHFDGKTIGSININSLKKNAFGEEELKLLDTIAHQIEIAINNAKKAEALHESKERYRVVAETASDAIITIDEESTIAFVNRTAERIFGYTVEEMLGQQLTMLMPDNLRQVHLTSLQRYTNTGEKRIRWEGIELPGLHKSGKLIPLEVSFGEFTRDAKHYFTGIIRDITERKRAEERFRLVVESAPNAIVTTDQRGKITYVNPKTEALFGYNREELIGKPVETLVPERFRREHPEYRKDFHADPQARPMGAGRDLFALRKDGSEVPVEIALTPIQTEEGLIVLSSIVDITQRKRAEERFRLVVESAPSAIAITDQRGKITYVNPKTEALFGYNREELIGKPVETLVPERFRREHPEYRKDFHADPQARPMGAGRDLFALRKDGSEVPVEIALTPIQTEEGLVVLSSIVDITQRKRSEQALRESEEKLRAIMDNTADAILVYDDAGNIVTINKEAERLFSGNGFKKLQSVWDIVPSEEKANFVDILRDVKVGNRLVDYEAERILADGERIPVSLGLVYVDEEGGRFIATVRDIRERVALRNKIVEFEKAQVFGKMAEGIAHHMGTPLASMLLRVQMLKEDVQELPKHGKLMEKLDSIERQIFYGQKVMQRLLKFASKPESIRRPERVSIILEDSTEMIRPLLSRPGIRLELSVDEDVKVKADIDLLELVFSDLMMNAVDAMPEGGMLSIDASKEDSEQMVNITISDTGTGIPQDVLPYVFEPFFTTKPAGKGTGLGLSVAKRIVHSHDGEISIESTEGGGTSVFIRLPIYTEED